MYGAHIEETNSVNVRYTVAGWLAIASVVLFFPGMVLAILYDTAPHGRPAFVPLMLPLHRLKLEPCPSSRRDFPRVRR